MLSIRTRKSRKNKVVKILQVKDLKIDHTENKSFTEVEEELTLEQYVKDRDFLEAKDVYNITLSLCETLINLNSLNYSIECSQLIPSNITINDNMKIYIKNLGVSKYFHLSNSNSMSISSFKSTYDNQQKLEQIINTLGILMYFMATGKEPVTMLQPLLEDSYGSNVESNLKRIIQRCFHIDIKKRYVSIEELNKEIIIQLMIKNKYEKIEKLCSTYSDSSNPLGYNRLTRVHKRKAKRNFNTVLSKINATLSTLL
ncbi:hypothetical protein [Clostridium omnivorum]|uniref:Protein kinase domain-containing protein n=1 Tax=Clostridium omnivorum TaxID=1604902 RepID=A0ABQ5N950_9CLOT|nr:hypothetical protein [Clostridium sp. E14]GLC31697.1 hypothetical protein bsdE14_31070 [Clostridium sp. E14]